jgi:hypothetical protein
VSYKLSKQGKVTCYWLFLLLLIFIGGFVVVFVVFVVVVVVVVVVVFIVVAFVVSYNSCFSLLTSRASKDSLLSPRCCCIYSMWSAGTNSRYARL